MKMFMSCLIISCVSYCFAAPLSPAVATPNPNKAFLSIDQIKAQWEQNYCNTEFSKIVFRDIDLLNNFRVKYPSITERYQNGNKIKEINGGRSFDPCNIRIVYYLPTNEKLDYTPELRQAHIYPPNSGTDPSLVAFNDAVLGTKSYTSKDVNGTPLMVDLCNDPCAVLSPELQILKVGDVNVSCHVISAARETKALTGSWQLWITQDKGMMPIKFISEWYSKKTGNIVHSRTYTVEKISGGNDIWYPGIVRFSVVTNGELIAKRKIEILDFQRGVTYDASFFEPNLPDDTTVIDNVRGYTYKGRFK
jgi:outer membrane lipoprotein-sorting protein